MHRVNRVDDPPIEGQYLPPSFDTLTPKYELWPALAPKFSDVEVFQRAIDAEKKKQRPNYAYIEAAERDMAIAQSMNVQTD